MIWEAVKLPAQAEPSESEIYQMLVALTRAKKRIYFLNTIGKETSQFLRCIDSDRIERLKLKA